MFFLTWCLNRLRGGRNSLLSVWFQLLSLLIPKSPILPKFKVPVRHTRNLLHKSNKSIRLIKWRNSRFGRLSLGAKFFRIKRKREGQRERRKKKRGEEKGRKREEKREGEINDRREKKEVKKFRGPLIYVPESGS